MFILLLMPIVIAAFIAYITYDPQEMLKHKKQYPSIRGQNYREMLSI